MSKYPTVLLFRGAQYAERVDAFLATNGPRFDCTFLPTSAVADLTRLWDPSVAILVTVGDTEQEYSTHFSLPPRIRMRWIHYNTDVFLSEMETTRISRSINYCFVHNVVSDKGDRQASRPQFSMFTTCYNSYSKIMRAYNSIKCQTMGDWEWVIVDDSPKESIVDDSPKESIVDDSPKESIVDDSPKESIVDDSPKESIVSNDISIIASNKDSSPHFQYLRALFAGDARVRLYDRAENSGHIGNVKNEAIALCRGKYVLEMDHDDELMPDTLAEACAVFDANEDVGFVYMDFANVYEDGRNFKYSDFYGLGYCGYYCQKWFNVAANKWQWVYVSITSQINNVTLMHLVSMPNHPRMWRRSVLMQMGSYSEFLPICDDQEIIMRTAITTKMAKINKSGYIQYMNDGGNFSLIRNAEINRIGPQYLHGQFSAAHGLDELCAQKQPHGTEPIGRRYACKQLWKRALDTGKETESPTNNFMNVLVPGIGIKKHICVLGYAALVDHLTELSANMAADPGIQMYVLDGTMVPDDLCRRLDGLGLGARVLIHQVRCYAFVDTDKAELKSYFTTMCATPGVVVEFVGDVAEIIEVDRKIPDNTRVSRFTNETPVSGSRASLINGDIQPLTQYLEIGVEYGTTFNAIKSMRKTAVDPDPKFTLVPRSGARMMKLTSDDYFKITKVLGSEYDVIFVDGMHQAEYVLRDVQNACSALFGWRHDPNSLGHEQEKEEKDEEKEDDAKGGGRSDWIPYDAPPADMSPPGREREREREPRPDTVTKVQKKRTGILYMDDVCPLNEAEQLKIPGKHYYENGILKYCSPWTGDTWKVFFYMIQHNEDNIFFTYDVYTHPSYRGVARLLVTKPFVFPEGSIDEINAYSYSADFSRYVQMLEINKSSKK